MISNFVKAFTEYSRPAEEEDQPEDCAEPVDYDYESCNESDNEPSALHSAADFLEAFDGDDDDFGDDEATPRRITLPPHFRCAAHTLNLLASSDFDKVLTSHQAYKKVFRKVMGKLHALWNSNGRSALTADLTYETLGRYLPRPVVTRWNSFFDCLSVLTFQDPAKINQLLSALNIPHVSNDEHSFIVQYLSIMAPIACALDVLQEESNCFLGCVLPVLVKVKSKLMSLTLRRDQSLMRDLIIEKLDARFSKLFFDSDYILASATHPRLKLAWLQSEEEKTTVKRKLEVALGSQAPPVLSPMSDDDFLAFDDRFLESGTELERYLKDKDKSLAMLDKYPSIKRLFFKTNTTLPSSAPVERLFSIAALVFTCKRSRLSDTLLEHLLLLKIFRNL